MIHAVSPDSRIGETLTQWQSLHSAQGVGFMFPSSKTSMLHVHLGIDIHKTHCGLLESVCGAQASFRELYFSISWGPGYFVVGSIDSL